MASSRVCSCCGRKIIGLPYTVNNKTYCYECFQKLAQNSESTEQELQPLYCLLKETFEITDVSESTISAIRRELKNGKKITGIMATITYYYKILGHTDESIEYLGIVIRDHYEEARKYYAEVNQMKERNAGIDINVAPVTVKISEKDLHKKRKNQSQLKIENL